MKKIFHYSFICIVLASLVLVSCEQKYEDGPRFSLRSAKSRVAGDWKIEKILYNGADVTAQSPDIASSKIVFEKGGTYVITGGSMDTGTWSMGEDGDDIMLTSSSSGSPMQTYRILKLKNKEMWWKQTQSNGDIMEFHLDQ